MLYRKIASFLEEHFRSGNDKIIILEGARQIGKSYIVDYAANRVFKNVITVDFAKDMEGDKLFQNIHTTDDFYFTLGSVAGESLDTYQNTIIFLDEIQKYPQYFTLLKFFREEKRYHFVTSGSLLGISLKKTVSIPVGSVIIKKMYQLDFEEFLIANNFSKDSLKELKLKYKRRESLDEAFHRRMLNLFKKYLLVGGLPDAVNTYLQTRNLVKVREVHSAIHALYKADAAQYEADSSKNLQIQRIYDMIPSLMEHVKKRVVAKNIQGRGNDRFANYTEEFEYLISSGISLDVRAVSNPTYPLAQTARKNLLKLYMNDVGLLTMELYGANIKPIMNDETGINLGSVYESVAAQELAAHGHELFYFDNRQKGEVDFLVDDKMSAEVLPIEIKSGKDYTVHSALNNLLNTADYRISSGMVFSNERSVFSKGKVIYFPIYFLSFVSEAEPAEVII